MKVTVYLDMLILVNTIINYLTFKTAAFVAGEITDWKRLVFSSLVCSTFAFVIFFDISLPASVIIKIFSVFRGAFLSYGFTTGKRYIKNCFYLLLVTLLYGGAMQAFFGRKNFVYAKNFYFYLDISPLVLIISVCAVYGLLCICDMLFPAKPSEYVRTLIFESEGGSEKVDALYDTGFRVRDLLGGKGIIMCDMDCARKIFSPEIFFRLEKFFLTGEYENKKFLPVFYSDLSGGGMIPAVSGRKIFVTDRKGNKKLIKNVALAVSPRPFSAGVNAIFGTEVFNMLGE